MPNVHILMTNHSDNNSMELLIDELPFIKENYDTFLVECIPQPLKNQEALNYLSKIMLTYELDLTKAAEQLNISKKHLLALKNEYQEDLTDEAKMNLKYEAVKEIRAIKTIAFESNINQLFYQYYYYHYLSQALKSGIDLVGIEHSSYHAGMGKCQADRDNEIVSNTRKATQQHRNCLMLVGATHGIDLIKNFQKEGSIKNSYTHLYCDNAVINAQSPSNLFRVQIEKGEFVLSENQSYLYCNLSNETKEQQSVLFEKRVLATKSKKPTYHNYGRTTLKDASSFCLDLSKLSGFSFFTTIDKNYVADALCEVNSKDEKQFIQCISSKTGIGDFFKTDTGKSVFVVRNTNDPERLDFLRNATKPM